MDFRDRLQASLSPDYTLEAELGGGGMSRIFVASDQRLGRKVVVKVIAPELAAGMNAERFQREIRLAASLQQANIVPLLTAGEADGLAWFIMPYVEGHSLRHALSSRTLSIGELTGILRDVARALSYAHSHGVVHRDIKPENILLSHGTAEVTDFGIAKAIAASRGAPDGVAHSEGTLLTASGASIGTPTYMSPEQAAGDPAVDHRSDIYSLGVVGYEMLEGRVPFSGSVQAIMMGHVSSPVPPMTRDAPESLRRVITRCLEKDPARRFQSADELLQAIEVVSTPESVASVARIAPRRLAAVGAGLVLLGVVAWAATAGIRERRWARTTAIPQITRLAERGESDSAWVLARRVREILPEDSALAALWTSFTRPMTFTSEPSEARLYRSSIEDTTDWILLGTTPTDTIFLPLRPGRLRVEKQGYVTQYGLSTFAPFFGVPGRRHFALRRSDDPDSGMVRVAGGPSIRAFLNGSDRMPPIPLADFDIQAREVTNGEYKRFVDAGGYRERGLWPERFDDEGRAISWEQALAKFVDRTGRPGPATWEAGGYPPGQADLPVGGVSWYEASAYAKFARLSLPTVYHWSRAAFIGNARWMLPSSNFEGNGPVRGGSIAAVSLYGAFDMAGNVREWCANDAGGGQRLILGGGWNDSPYQFTDAYAVPAMNRAPINGIRLARYTDPDSVIAKAGKRVIRAFSDYAKEKQVAPALLQSYRQVFDYDRTPLNARVDSRDTTSAEWIVERVSFDAAYGGERMQAYILLPKTNPPPYQSVIFWPGSGVFSAPPEAESRNQTATFVVQSGRAYVLPTLKSTYGRADGTTTDLPDSTFRWRDHVAMWVKDIRRTVDYLSTRSDIDTAKFAFFGHSWGANMAPPTLVAEPRFKAAVLYVAGLTMERGRPETDPFYYLPHVKAPVLMLNGKYDFFYPLETSQRPFFEALGLPADRKKWIVYDGGHDVPRTALIAETLKWLDLHLGPVR